MWENRKIYVLKLSGDWALNIHISLLEKQTNKTLLGLPKDIWEISKTCRCSHYVYFVHMCNMANHIENTIPIQQDG